MKHYLILLSLLSLNVYSCQFNVEPAEFNFWGYVYDTNQIFEYILGKDGFEHDKVNPEITFHLDVYQDSGRFFKYAKSDLRISDSKITISKKKICFMVNCHTKELANMIVNSAEYIKDTMNSHCKLIKPRL